MPSVTWVNGEFVEAADARVSAFDASVQHAVGLFETMLAVGEHIVALHAHLLRLAASARDLDLVERLRTGPLADACQHVINRAALDRARLRLTLTGGDLNLLAAGTDDERTPTIIIHASPAQRYPPEMFERGIAVAIADAKANPLNPHAAHKTLDYWWRLRELQRAARAGAGEGLVLQVTNHVSGGCVSNLFAVKDDRLVTPTARGEEATGPRGVIPSPVLPGVTRAHVVELAQMQGVATERRLLTIDDVLDADEVFLTNSSWGVLPVTNVERAPIGDAVPGELTTSLREQWLRAIDDRAI